MHFDRQKFPSAAKHASLLRILLAQDGSTTRLCQALIDAPVSVHLHQQHRTVTVPEEVSKILGGTAWLQRITSLHSESGEVLMDNLSFTRLDVPPEWFTAGLDQGHAPIGHLLDKLFIKRGNVTVSNEVKKLLWEAVGAPDSNASRSYQISTQDNTFMLIFEVFRGAMTHQIT